MTARVFISYAQEPAEHRDEVRRLWELLRRCGVDAKLDLSANAQNRDWTVWMAEQFDEADFVLCVASAAYKRRSEERERAGRGRGVQWEARLIRTTLHRDPKAISRFLAVVLPSQSEEGIPQFLMPGATSTYQVKDFTVHGAEPLLRLLLDQPEVVEEPLPPPYVFPVADPRSTDNEPVVGDLYRHTDAMADLVRHHRLILAGRTRDHGDDHPTTLAAAHALAYWTGQSGRYADAVRQFAEVERLRTTVLGADSPRTLGTRLNRVVMSGWADPRYKVLPELEGLLEDHIRVLGLGNRQTLRVWRVFVQSLRTSDRPEDMLHQFDDLLVEHIRVLGEDDAETHQVRASQAWWRFRVDCAQGLSSMRFLVDRVRETLGFEHPSTLYPEADLARMISWEGDRHAALVMARRVADAAVRVLGRNHPTTLDLRGSAAFVADRAGEHREAQNRYQKLYRDQFAVIGRHHRDTLRTARELERTARTFDSATTSLGKSQAVLALCTRVLPIDDPDVLLVRGDVAWLTANTGDRVESGRLFGEVIADSARVLGPAAPETFDRREDHATALGLGGDPAAATANLRVLLDDVVRVLGPTARRARWVREALDEWSAEQARIDGS